MYLLLQINNSVISVFFVNADLVQVKEGCKVRMLPISAKLLTLARSKLYVIKLETRINSSMGVTLS